MIGKFARHILIVIAALAMVSCMKETIVTRDAITFAPVAEKSTKTIIDGTTYPDGKSFVVSAYHNGTDTYFSDLEAAYSITQDGTKLWETSTAEYWPLGGSLKFNAYSPASVSDITDITIDSDGISVTDYTIQTTDQMTTDLCYASATVPDCANHPESVPLVFSHALSQVVFRVKAAAYYTNTTISLTSLSLSGICSVGDFSSGSWSNWETPYTYTLSSATTPLTYDGEHEPETIVICSYLFVPQEIPADANINVGYSITQTISGDDYSLANPPVSIALRNTVTEWQPGKKYVYTLNIGLNNLINFTASAANWGDPIEGSFVVE